jgi:hypothetical protein
MTPQPVLHAHAIKAAAISPLIRLQGDMGHLPNF